MSVTIEFLRGLTVERVVWDEQTLEWVFSFGNTVSLRVAVPWRIRDGKAILLGNADHKQLFGLPEPVNGENEAQSLFASPVINAVVVSPTSDFHIEFGNGHTLEVFNASAGYEGWQLNNGGHSMVAQGGGQLVEWRRDA
jgi:Family of unknown function (DUF6188)